ncbi:MAG: chromosome partitioning protein [Verrucomicrobia bacterium]|nr:MAG: chromosome partitioning protein [Verrucomicrobiota bacterium]
MKGGVGKTTLAMQLAFAAGAKGLKVLAVDLDPQSNLSQAALGARRYVEHLKNDRPTVIQIFEGYMPSTSATGGPTQVDPDKVVVKHITGKHETVDLLPSRLELCRTLRNPTGKERKLAKFLARVQRDYDLILIDCAPTDSILTDAAYFASRYILVPVKPEFMAAIGLPLLAKSLSSFSTENEDHRLEMCGIVFNHSSSYSSGPEGRAAIRDVKDVAKQEKWPVFENHVQYLSLVRKVCQRGHVHSPHQLFALDHHSEF